MKNFAAVLSEARSDAAMTRAELSTYTGVPVGTLFNWETGRCRPRTLSGLAVVAEVLDIPARELLPA